jgi:hypothetical protein
MTTSNERKKRLCNVSGYFVSIMDKWGCVGKAFDVVLVAPF